MTNLYSILDVKTQMYGPIISFHNDMAAIRAFMEMIISGDRNSMISLYPSDYILTVVGKFDQDKGLVEGIPRPEHVITGMEAMTRAISENEQRRRLRQQLQGVEQEQEQVEKDVLENKLHVN